MKSKEVTLDIIDLKRKGLSDRHIARQLGLDRRTVKKYVDDPGKAFKPRQPAPTRKSKLDPFFGNIKTWMEEDPSYRAMWMYDRLKPMGYTGGYDILKNFVRRLKSKRAKVAYLRFETEPGLQAQADWAEFAWALPDGKSQVFYLFAMILGFSRKLYCELVERCDLTTFLDCHIRAFEYFGGVPGEILYDRMRNVFIRKLAGKTEFNRSLTSMAIHYGFKPMVAPAFAPWVKGKIERPIDFIREGFWRGYGFTSLERSNHDLLAWLEMKSQRIHGTTHERVCDRFDREKPALGALPGTVFDTSYQVYKPVRKDCTVHFGTNRYMVPHTLVGENLVLRVKNRVIRMYHDSTHIVTYCIPEKKGQFLFEQRFVDALKNDREMNRIKYGRGIRCRKGRAVTISPSLPPWAVDVEIRSLNAYDLVHEQSPVLREEVAA